MLQDAAWDDSDSDLDFTMCIFFALLTDVSIYRKYTSLRNYGKKRANYIKHER